MLQKAFGELAASVESLRAANDETEMLANATNFLWAFGHAVVGYIWLSVVTAAAGLRDEEAAGKRAAAKFFFAFEVPKIAAWLAPIHAGNRLTVEMREGWF
jgi:butyryl-CoA dehydrogenase